MNPTTAPTVAVVGGGGAIGRAIALEFARAGYLVALIDRDAQRLQKVADELARAGADVHHYAFDVTQTDQAQALIERVVRECGRLDVLVHSAGLTQISPARRTELDVYRRVMEVNFFGVVAITQAALPELISRNGQIVALSSVAGFAPLIGRTGYCASKYALHGYFDTLRCELARDGVGILLVCPSFVASDFATRGLAADGSTLSGDRSTTGTPMSPEVVAAQVYRAARRRQPLLVLSWRGKMAYWLSRLAPGWYQRAIVRRFTVELDR